MTNIQPLLISHIAALIIGFAAAFFIIGGGSQTSRQDANYDQKLDNITNSIVELKNITMSIQNKQNGLINVIRVRPNTKPLEANDVMDGVPDEAGAPLDEMPKE